MQAALALVRHLLRRHGDRVAVVVFQEQQARLITRFTRNLSAARRSLEAVVPGGLTPLGAGLRESREYLEGSGRRPRLLLLLTDGIPTVATTPRSPLEESLEEAARLPQARVRLYCVGLEPNERYLRQLVDQAHGRLFVVPELDPERLYAVARELGSGADAGYRARR